MEDQLSITQPNMINIPLYPHQLKSIEIMTNLEKTERIALGNLHYIVTRLGVLADVPGYGKCEKIDTPIVMFSGEIKMVQNIEVGDLLMGDDSKPRKVLSTTKGHGEMFKIKQKNGGEDYTVNINHVLSLKISSPKILRHFSNEETVEKFNPYIDVQLEDFMKLPPRIKRHLKGYRVGVEFEEKPVEIDPYFVGLCLGDGKSNDPYITNLLKSRHIPISYKINSRNNRLKLLAGLIDSDGHYSRGYYEITQKNTVLANDIVFLCRSLGFRTTINKKSCMYEGEMRDSEYNIISFSGLHIDQIPCRKKLTKCTPNKNQMCCEIEVEPVGQDDYYGFTLDGNHRYLHSDFTVTHNSLSTLGLISQSLNDPVDSTYYEEEKKTYKYVSSIAITPLEQTKCSLILVNVSLLSQWTFELNRTLLRYKVVYNKNDIENISLDDFDVILVSNNIYNLFSQVYRKKSWKRFIIDEPMSLKFPSAMEPINAKFYWAVTATPIELYTKRRSGFMNELLPEDLSMFTRLINKNDDAFVKSSYNMPLTHYTKYKCSKNISNLFEGLVSLNVQEMIEAGSFDDVFTHFNVDENEKTIMGAFRTRKNKRIEELKKESSSTQTVEKIQMIENQLKIFDERLKLYVEENNCILCDNPFGQTIQALSCCQNLFCGCEYVSPCKVCKSIETSNIIIPFPNFNKGNSTINISLNKIDTLLNIVGDSVGKKILIFSNYNESFSVIKKFLDEKHLSYLDLKGSKEKRDSTIDLYKTGNINILLLNTILSGAGLNLPETTDIILYHRICSYQEIQVIGRANRIGRQTELAVHYL
jgi:hypothetical protein